MHLTTIRDTVASSHLARHDCTSIARSGPVPSELRLPPLFPPAVAHSPRMGARTRDRVGVDARATPMNGNIECAGCQGMAGGRLTWAGANLMARRRGAVRARAYTQLVLAWTYPM